MKKIWVCPVYKGFTVTKRIPPYKFNFEFTPHAFEPLAPIPQDKVFGNSLQLLGFLPSDEYNTITNGYQSIILRWTDSEELIKREWFEGVINIINHLKDLEFHGLIKLDQDDLEKHLPIFLEDLEKHRNEFPELWI